MRARILIRFSYILVFFLCIPSSAFAATNVTSDIATDTEWTLDGSPYVVNFSDNDAYFQHLLKVAPGVTLTIDPGVVVKFGAYNGITIKGTLRAEGTADNPIIFTSLEDDTAGGDTNNDSTDTTPMDEQWMHLEFSTGSSGIFNHTIVRYGGARRIFVANTGIANYGGTLTIDHTTLTHNGFDGLGQYRGHTTLSNSIISGQDVGISMNGGELVMSDTHIYNNAVSGIDHSDGTLSITHSEIDHNGTGIVAESQGFITVDNSSIHDNPNGIYNNESQISVDARNNWWGTASGPGGNDVYRDVVYTPWLTSNPFIPPDPCIALGTCASNVLFLPGIEGSRLYEGVSCRRTAEEKLWEPIGESLLKILRGAGDDKVKRLFLDSTGQSICSDTYAKVDDVIDSVKGSNIYKLFIDEMNGLETDGTINDWKPVAYDWRLSLTDLLSKGAERDGKIYYTEATSTPYIEQTLRALAGSSKTGRVTIVAHSNGGLVAKALLNKLGSSPSSSLVDKIVMVGAPQSGAPLAVGALLYGLDQGISKWGIPILHSAVARELAQNSPMAYHLLPSEEYLESTAGDSTHPVARFAGDAYAKEISAYGATITNIGDLDTFLLAAEGGRVKPAVSDTSSAEILNSSLIDYANSTHATLDSWTPPEGIEVSQIAGWGADTVAGIDFYTPSPVNALTALEPMRAYRPLFTEDGDGVVPVPSALMMASGENVKRYWVNLDSYRKDTSIKIEHKNIFEIQSLEKFIKNLIENSTSTLPAYISTNQPSPETDNKKLTFFLHSPLTLQIADASGNVTGLGSDDSMTQDIPDSTYGEFGDVKYIIVPQGSQYQLTMHGQASGTFSLDIQESSGDVITASSTIANVPTTANTLASLTISGGIDTASALTVDVNGDGQSEITLTPEVGEIVNYEPPASAQEPIVSSARNSGRVKSSSIIATITPLIASTTPETTTPVIITTTPPRPSISTSHVPKRSLLSPSPATVVNTIPNLSQTASVYDASQQPIFARLGTMIYNGLHRLLRGLKVIFLIQK